MADDKPMLGRLLSVVAVTACLLGGAAAAWVVTGSAASLDGEGPRGWKTTEDAGDSRAGFFLRATVARTALWMLPKSEVTYFIAERDDAGNPLDTNCTYELRGEGDLPARWWSIGAYADYHFVPNSLNRYSFSKTTVVRSPDGGYSIRLSNRPQPGNWLPLGSEAGSIQLMARLYQPDAVRTSDPTKVPLPTIRKLSCA